MTTKQQNIETIRQACDNKEKITLCDLFLAFKKKDLILRINNYGYFSHSNKDGVLAAPNWPLSSDSLDDISDFTAQFLADLLKETK